MGSQFAYPVGVGQLGWGLQLAPFFEFAPTPLEPREEAACAGNDKQMTPQSHEFAIFGFIG